MLLRRFALVSLALGAGAFAVSSSARAHILLDDPAPLTNNDNAKQAPCGCIFGSAELPCIAEYETTTYAPGQQVIVSWQETVNHAGDFRVSFSPKPPSEVTEEDFTNAEIQVTIPDEINGGAASVMITLPDTPCEECTIQLRQNMVGSPQPYYYSCASISIVPGGGTGGEGGGPGPGPGPGGGGEGGGVMNGNGGGGTDAAGGAGDDGEPTAQPNPPSDSCSAAVGRPGTSGMLGLSVAALALCLAFRRRR